MVERTQSRIGRVAARTQAPEDSKIGEQAALIWWWRLSCRKYGVPEEALLSIQDGMAEGGPRAALLRRQGARRGTADLFLAVPRGTFAGLWLSLKRRGLRMRPEERRFLQNMKGLGFDAAVCRKAGDARDKIHAYMVQHSETYQKNVS